MDDWGRENEVKRARDGMAIIRIVYNLITGLPPTHSNRLPRARPQPDSSGFACQRRISIRAAPTHYPLSVVCGPLSVILPASAAHPAKPPGKPNCPASCSRF